MSAMTDLFDALKAYEVGLVQNIAIARQNKGLINDPVLQGVLKQVPGIVPGINAALTMAQQVQNAVASVTGVNSTLSNVVKAAFSGNIITAPINEIKALFNGRTFQSDQYYGAADYSYYWLGQPLGQIKNVPDSLIPVALKWYVDKLGVFISGPEHVKALQQSPQAYIALSSVNAYTTTDMTRVAAASSVAKAYMPYNNAVGGWMNCVGVYDNELVQLAQAGYNNYFANLQALKQQASGVGAANGQPTGTTVQSLESSGILGIPTSYVLIAIAIIIIVILLISFT